LSLMILGDRLMRVAGTAVEQRFPSTNQHVSPHIAVWTSSAALLDTSMVLVTLIFIFVVLPAVWSSKPDRRAAAFKVLNLILRFILRCLRQ
jgi:hypothetical protein